MAEALFIPIGPVGPVPNMTMIGGPGELRQPSIDAVKRWIYRPLVILPKPRSFEIEIKTIFRLG